MSHQQQHKPINNNSHQLEIDNFKSQLSLLQKQLSTSPESTDTSNPTILSQLLSLTNQIEQFCHNLNIDQQQLKLNQQQQQIEFDRKIHQQQVELDRLQNQQQLITIELKVQQHQHQIDVDQQKSDLQHQKQLLDQQQTNLNQQLHELEMKQKQIELERIEFDLYKNNCKSSHDSMKQVYDFNSLIFPSLNEHKSNQSTYQHEQIQSSTISSTPLQSHPLSNQTNSHHEQPLTTSANDNELLQQLHRDYEAIKFLYKENTTSHQIFNQHFVLLDQRHNDVVTLESKLLHYQQFEPRLIQLEQTQLQFTTQLQQLQQQFYNYIQNEQQEQMNIQQQEENKKLAIEQLKVKKADLAAVLVSNRILHPSNPSMCIQIENIPGLQMTCTTWSDTTLYDVIYKYLINQYLVLDLKSYEQTIRISNIYISTPCVLNGEWIQIQGDNALIDMHSQMLYDFIRVGYNTHPYSPCALNCQYCHSPISRNLDPPTNNRHLFRIKWE